MVDPRPVVLATGGTGGHVFPAEALAGELEARGVSPEAAASSARSMTASSARSPRSWPMVCFSRAAAVPLSPEPSMTLSSRAIRPSTGVV